MVPTLAELRQRAGYTQEQFAARIGVDRATVSRWENNGRWSVEPHPMARLAIAQVLGVDPATIEFGRTTEARRGRPRKPAAPPQEG